MKKVFMVVLAVSIALTLTWAGSAGDGTIRPTRPRIRRWVDAPVARVRPAAPEGG